MFAYVQFVRDKVKVIVPVEDVKDFVPRHKAVTIKNHQRPTKITRNHQTTADH